MSLFGQVGFGIRDRRVSLSNFIYLVIFSIIKGRESGDKFA